MLSYMNHDNFMSHCTFYLWCYNKMKLEQWLVKLLCAAARVQPLPLPKPVRPGRLCPTPSPRQLHAMDGEHARIRSAVLIIQNATATLPGANGSIGSGSGSSALGDSQRKRDKWCKAHVLSLYNLRTWNSMGNLSCATARVQPLPLPKPVRARGVYTGRLCPTHPPANYMPWMENMDREHARIRSAVLIIQNATATLPGANGSIGSGSGTWNSLGNCFWYYSRND